LTHSICRVRFVSETRESLIGVFDFAWERLLTRLQGIGDEEYLWEPVGDSWSIRKSDSGEWTMDRFGANEGPPPLTTVAWRICHVGGQVLGGFSNWFLEGGSPYNVDFTIPSDATSATDFLGRGYQRWRNGIVSFPAERLWLPIGAEFGPFGYCSEKLR
jgi:hypothetical protein